MRSTLPMGIAAIAALTACAQADIVLFFDDFEASGIRPEWGPTAVETSAPSFTTFMGRYATGGVSLYPDLGEAADDTTPGDGDGGPRARVYYVEFDFFAIDSWDSSSPWGPDTLHVAANGATLLSATFSNHGEAQTFAGSPTVGPAFLGYASGWKDSIYRDIRLEFELAPGADALRLVWSGLGLQGINDESWGIDNVEVGVVPAPAPVALGSLGLVAALGRRRRG